MLWKEAFVKLPSKTYNTIRSFVESSTSPKYLHNIPVRGIDGTIKFFKAEKWIVALEVNWAYLYTWEGDLVAIYTPSTIYLLFNGKKMTYDYAKYPMLTYVVNFTSDVPFARHIMLHELIKAFEKKIQTINRDAE